MATIEHDVVGIGNAIVDIIARCKHEFLVKHNLAKGHMTLVDANTVSQLYKNMGPAVEISGGSAANTMVGVASLGGRAAFVGKVSEDDFGKVFAHDIRSAGVTFETKPSVGGAPTARSLILVTPDGERTMNTFLGVSPELSPRDVDAKLIASSRILYLEGYLFDRPDAQAAFRHAANLAEAAGREVALTLSDSFCVERHRVEFIELIRDRVDILFANESEITALYKTSSFEEASRQAKSDASIAVLTRSAKGSVIFRGDKAASVPAARVRQVVDTTGAGDLYAAGFLFGYAAGKPLDVCGSIGSLAAAEVIGHMGARPETSLAELVAARGL
jgi:sugar/nucleoside kinase (ribokinase family)